ncbi:hypothetical protein Bca52824_027177 [Brassica carinata]|uniref:Uncharacterized protein n=1 Tax=Brassica carinata TaxID=52824 RepID=A0A8X7SI10_BRACI|nr:hypothetical protein Bca52824_027177 [Brassica carinata]
MPSIRARRDAGSGDGIERELRGDDIEEPAAIMADPSGVLNENLRWAIRGTDGRSPDYSETIERSQRRPRSVVERLTPFCCHRDGTIEELPDLAPELDRSAEIGDQDWGVGPTLSDYESLSSLMQDVRASGVTFVIPRSDQRPWTPPVGYCCVYESFFGDDSKLWFPIPRLITSYCFRRGIALSQLMNGAVRIAVALMVMAAEIDVSMTDRIFEELTQTQPKPNGVFSVQMRSGLNIFASPLIKTKRWKCSYFYVKADEAGFEDPPGADCRVLWSRGIVGHPNTFGPWDAFRRDLPKIAALRLQEWRSFDRRRIRRQRGRIAKVDWSSNLLCEKPKGKRLKLPIAGMSSTLGDTSFGPTVIASGANSADVSALIDREPALVSATAGLEAEGAVDVPPPSKRRKKTKSATKPRADPPLDGDDGDGARSPRMRRGDDGIDGDREGVRMESSASPAGGLSSGGGAPGSSRTTDGALATLEAAACKNMLLTGYEAALRKAVLDLEKAKEKIRVKEAELETFKKEKLDEVNELEIARNRISQLEKEKVEDSEKTKRAMERLRQSRSRELLSERNCVAAAAERRFEKFRKYMADRDRKEEKRLLHGTALGTLDAVNLLEKKGLPVPRELKDLFVANEAVRRRRGGHRRLSRDDLALSPPRSASAVAPRSPIFGNVAPLVAQVSTVARQPTTILSGDRAGALDRPFGTVSGPFGTVSGPSNRDDSSEGQETRVLGREETGAAGTRDASSLDFSTEA